MPRLLAVEPRLHVHDLQRAIAFYRGGIGGQRAATDPTTCTLCFDTVDVLALHADLKARIAIECGPEVYFYGRREFGVRDPDGNLLVFSEETAAPTCRE